MSAVLLADSGFFSEHWNVVLLIGFAFFVVQLISYVRFVRRVRGQERKLGGLTETEEPSDNRTGIEDASQGFAWLKWVHSIFPADATTPPGNYTRDEVLQELDTRLASDSDYLLLQRLGVIAPLLGVLLTVAGFFFLEVNETEEQSLQTILQAVRPLVVGLAAGAVLAAINQVLLYWAGGRAESLRMIARTWFDAAIWRHIGLDTQAATVKAITAIERMANSIAASAEHHLASSNSIGESTTAMKDAAAQFREVVDTFGGEIKDMPATLRDLRDATAESANALEELIPVGSRAVANLDVSVAAFRTTLDHDFTAATRLHEKAGEVLSETASTLGETAASLDAGAKQYSQAVDENAATLKSLTESLQSGSSSAEEVLVEYRRVAEEIAPARETLTAAVGRLSEAGQSLTKLVDSEVTPSQQTIGEAALAFTESATQLSMFVEQLGPVTEQLAALHQTLRGTAQSIEEVRGMRGELERLTESVARAGEVSDAVARLPEQLDEFLTKRLQPAAVPKSTGGLVNWLRRVPAETGNGG